MAWWVPLAVAGAGLAGDLFGSGGDAPEDKSPESARIRGEYDRYIAEMQQREQQRQYNIEQMQNVTRQLEQLPMRDQITYLVQQRLGLPPSAFVARDIYNPSTSARVPQMGGVDMEAYRQRAAAYQPGMGGLDPVYEAYQTMGADLGYGNEPLMDQRGVFGGNRNPEPGQPTYDASAPQSIMGGYNPHAPYGSDWTPIPPEHQDLMENPPIVTGYNPGSGSTKPPRTYSGPGAQNYVPLNQPSFSFMGGGAGQGQYGSQSTPQNYGLGGPTGTPYHPSYTGPSGPAVNAGGNATSPGGSFPNNPANPYNPGYIGQQSYSPGDPSPYANTRVSQNYAPPIRVTPPNVAQPGGSGPSAWDLLRPGVMRMIEQGGAPSPSLWANPTRWFSENANSWHMGNGR